MAATMAECVLEIDVFVLTISLDHSVKQGQLFTQLTQLHFINRVFSINYGYCASKKHKSLLNLEHHEHNYVKKSYVNYVLGVSMF